MAARELTVAEAALELLERNGDSHTVETAKRLVAERKAEWVWDPEVAQVAGLVEPGTNKALVVVYLADDDFETTHEFDDA